MPRFGSGAQLHRRKPWRFACRHFRAALTDWLDEPLTITKAAEECPWWKSSTLAKKVRAGDLPQAGEHGAPLLRRRDLFGVTDIHSSEVEAWAEEMVHGCRLN